MIASYNSNRIYPYIYIFIISIYIYTQLAVAHCAAAFLKENARICWGVLLKSDMEPREWVLATKNQEQHRKELDKYHQLSAMVAWGYTIRQDTPVRSSLVGGLEHFWFFHSVGNIIIIAIDEVILFRGVGQPPTSSQWFTPLASEVNHPLLWP